MDEYRKYEPIFGSWYLSRSIGKGSFGKVFEITREEYGTTYRAALKVISVPQDDEDIKSRMTDGSDLKTISEYYEGILKDIINENELMAKLKGNSNIVSYEDHQIIPHEDGIGYDIFIRMELLTPLVDRLLVQKLDEEEVVKLGIDICKALEICHGKNIIHRDIKPHNIFISDNGDYKLGDFGIARTMEKTTGGMSRKGTYKYMAPEVFRGDHYDSTADIYSLGLVLYTLLNGNRGPFLPAPPAKVTHNDEEEARMRRFRGEPVPAPDGAGQMLGYIIRKACSFDPAARYRTAAQMRKDLENYLNNYEIRMDEPAPAYAGEETVPMPPSGSRPVPARYDRPPASAGSSMIRKLIPVFAVCAVLLLAAGIYIITSSGGGNETTAGNSGSGKTGSTETAGSSSSKTGSSEQTDGGQQVQEKQTDYPDDAVEYNGHHYKVYNDHIYWTDAEAACESMNGHLATASSADKQEFLEGLLEQQTDGSTFNYWIGGFDAGHEGEWAWVTGEPWTYTNWRDGQPDNGQYNKDKGGSGDHNYLQMCMGSTDSDRYMLWWDMSDSGISENYTDAPNYKHTDYTGYICEWDE